MDDYISDCAKKQQDAAVVTRQGIQSSTSLYFWTHRSTKADICSIITSTILTSNQNSPAALREKRVRSSKTFKISAYKSPLESTHALSNDEHERMNQALWDERTAFVKLLSDKKKFRLETARSASVKIQSLARGYFVRSNKTDLMKQIVKRHDVCQQIRNFLIKREIINGEEGKPWVVTRHEFQKIRHDKESKYALKIQNAYRVFAAVGRVRRIVTTAYQARLNAGATKIQAMGRGKMARTAVRREQKRVAEERLHFGASFIQRQYRGHAARVRVHKLKTDRFNNAVDCLQRALRCALARRKVARKRTEVRFLITDKMARTITKFFKKIVATIRGNKIRNATMKFVREAATVKVQCMVRRVVSTRRVVSKRRKDGVVHKLCLSLQAQRIVRGYNARNLILKKRRQQNELPQTFQLLAKGLEKETIDAITFDEDKKYNPNDVDPNGNTVLSVAATRGLIDVVRKCLVWGTDVNLKNKNGLSALELAVLRRHPISAEYLVSKESVQFEKEGKTLLHECARAGGMSGLAQALCENGVHVNSVDPETGRTPLMEACLMAMSEKEGRLKAEVDNGGGGGEEKKDDEIGFTESLLSEAGGDEDEGDDDEGDDEELIKSLTKHARVVAVLLRFGADPVMVDKEGNTALHYAAQVGNMACVETILNDGRNSTHKGEASKEAELDMSKAVAIGKGWESAYVKDAAGRTPWVVASLNGFLGSAELLKELGKVEKVLFGDDDIRKFVVNLTTPDLKDKITYRQKLTAVASFDRVGMANQLKELTTYAGMMLDGKCVGDGCTAAMASAKASNVACFRMCVELGGGMQRQDDKGRTPIHFAAGAHDPFAAVNMLKSVIDGVGEGGGAKQDVVGSFGKEDDKGRKAVHYAALRANFDAIEVLQDNCHSCSVKSRDSYGNTAMHYLCSDTKGEIYAMMLKEFGFSSSMERFLLPPKDETIAICMKGIRRLGGLITSENNDGKTPIMLACENGNLAVLRIILSDYKSDEELGGKVLVNAACAAIKKNKLDALRLITNHDRFNNSHAHSAGPGGDTPLGCAIKNDFVGIIKYLIGECGVNPSKQCSEGALKESALHCCARSGNLETLEVICGSSKITPDLYTKKNKKGYSPVMYSVMRKNYEVSMRLIKGGADPNDCGDLGWVSSWLFAAIMRTRKKFGHKKKEVIEWKGKRFFMFGLVEDEVGMVAVPGNAKKGGVGMEKPKSRGGGLGNRPGTRERPKSGGERPKLGLGSGSGSGGRPRTGDRPGSK